MDLPSSLMTFGLKARPTIFGGNKTGTVQLSWKSIKLSKREHIKSLFTVLKTAVMEDSMLVSREEACQTSSHWMKTMLKKLLRITLVMKMMMMMKIHYNAQITSLLFSQNATSRERNMLLTDWSQRSILTGRSRVLRSQLDTLLISIQKIISRARSSHSKKMKNALIN